MIVIGNIGRDPEVRQQNDNKTAVFSVATSEERKSRDGEIKVHTEWHRIVAYRKLADMVESSIRKGLKVCVIGKMRSSTWDDKKTGEKKTSWSIEADDVFIHVRETSSSSDYGSDSDPSQISDDDIPF